MRFYRVITAFLLFFFSVEVIDASTIFVRSSPKIKKSSNIELKVKYESKSDSTSTITTENFNDDSDYMMHGVLLQKQIEEVKPYILSQKTADTHSLLFQTEIDPPHRPPSLA